MNQDFCDNDGGYMMGNDNMNCSNHCDCNKCNMDCCCQQSVHYFKKVCTYKPIAFQKCCTCEEICPKC